MECLSKVAKANCQGFSVCHNGVLLFYFNRVFCPEGVMFFYANAEMFIPGNRIQMEIIVQKLFFFPFLCRIPVLRQPLCNQVPVAESAWLLMTNQGNILAAGKLRQTADNVVCG